MKWKKLSDYCIESEQGHRISKAMIRDKVIYTAWEPCEPDNPYAKRGWLAIWYGEDYGQAKAEVERRKK